MIDDMLKFIGGLITYSGGAAASVYILYIYIIKNSIYEFFTKRLEDYRHLLNKELEEHKHIQNIDIERLRTDMKYISNRLAKYKDREFDVIEDAWNKLLDAIGRFFVVTEPFKQYPDLNKMPYGQVIEFLKNSNLSDYQKEQLAKADNKLDYYIENIFWQQLNEAADHIYKYHNTLLYKKIYIEKELYDLLDKYDKALMMALIDCRIGKESDDHLMINNSYKSIKGLAETILPNIEERMRNILLVK